MTGIRYVVVVEVSMVANRARWVEMSSLTRSYVRVQASRRLVDGHRPPFLPGAAISLAQAPSLITDAVRSLRVCDVSFPLECTWADMGEVDFCMRLYQLRSDDSDGDDDDMPAVREERVLTLAGDDDESVPALTLTALPHKSLEGQWESLYYGEGEAASLDFKRDIVSYVDTAMRFARAGINPHLIAWNRLVLFCGPPGTGKTSLCRALAQKLAIRFATCGYPRACLLDINAHSLFSRWFSESGKQVLHLFEQIHRIAADASCLVCCVIDEVESLAAARVSAMKGNEPSDSIRVVNALLTQIDCLQRRENILVLSTSNLTSAIDEALLDRADKRVYVGPPGLHARQAILQMSVLELVEKGLVTVPAEDESNNSSDAVDAGICVDVEWRGSASRSLCARAAGDEVDKSEDAGEGAGAQSSFPVNGYSEESPEMRNEEAPDTMESTSTSTPAASSDARGACRARPRYTLTSLLHHIAEVSEGLNGRTLKKLPFLAYGKCMCSSADSTGLTAVDSSGVRLSVFLEALFDVARQATAEAAAKQIAKP